MRRVRFWLAIGMFGAAAPAAADTLRFSNTAYARGWGSEDWSRYCTCDKAEMQR